jgi:hypothetical protein
MIGTFYRHMGKTSGVQGAVRTVIKLGANPLTMKANSSSMLPSKIRFEGHLLIKLKPTGGSNRSELTKSSCSICFPNCLSRKVAKQRGLYDLRIAKTKMKTGVRCP